MRTLPSSFPHSRIVFAIGAALLISTGWRAGGQQLETTSDPVFVYGKEWPEPVPQTVLDGDELARPDKIAASLERVPNATLNAAGANSFTDVYSVRGLGNTPNFSKQALTLYVDGVPSSSTYTNFSELGDLEDVTIFRGPQGDFFGKNSEAGIVELRTIVPGETKVGSASATAGSYDLASFHVLAAGPLKDQTAFAKFEAGYLTRDGFLENTFLGTRPDFVEHLFARAALRLIPAKDWEIVFSAEFHDARDGVQRFAPLFTPDPFRVAFDFDGRTNIRGDIEAVTLSRTLDFGRLTLITSHRDWNLEPYEADFDYSPAPIVRGKFILGQEQFAQEIRLESTETDASWIYRAGFFADRVFSDGMEVFAFPGFDKEIAFDDTESEAALFGRATWRLGHGWEATAGMRLAYNEESIARTRRVSFTPDTSFDSDRSEWNVQPRIALVYHSSPQTTAYFNSTFGYKTGGFSFLETDPALADFKRERVWSNEIGLRTTCLDHRLEFRGAAFLNRVEDYQVERPAVGPDITVFNAPLVLSWGGELEIEATPVKGLRARAGLGYTWSQFREYNDPFTGVSYRGNRTPFSPEFTATLEARYNFRGMFAQVEVVASGETFYDEANTPSMREGPHTQFNVRVGYETERFRISAFCENVGDARYFTQKITYAGVGTPAPPRTFGATFTLKL
jgi:outer membrane receptor protein involved in Fe transport